MIKFPVYNLKGEKVKEIELSEKVFGAKRNDALLHQVFVSQYANRRQVLAHTKDRAERAGSGIKPWRQKGTGRARVRSGERVESFLVRQKIGILRKTSRKRWDKRLWPSC